eukprot:GCRY01001680.1.p1 GENE.GCRY01001680.1~~GCRY01001680.1.p1  ORF type:complete len:408 (+),score=149.32 GCRY01001680.1:441-1664(+)
MRSASETGWAEAQTEYARMLLKGIGGGRNFREAMVLLEDAADSGYAEGQSLFGEKLMERKKYGQARKWLEAATEQSHRVAAYNLGLLYYDALGVAQNFDRAAELWQASVDQEYAPAQCKLGECYVLGRGVARDVGKGLMLLRLSANQAHPPAEYQLGVMLQNGICVEKNEAEAYKQLESAAEHRYREGEFAFGLILLDGLEDIALAPDPARGAVYVEKAAEKGLAEAQFTMARLCECGIGVEYNGRRALEWMNKAADSGFEIAEQFRTRPWTQPIPQVQIVQFGGEESGLEEGSMPELPQTIISQGHLAPGPGSAFRLTASGPLACPSAVRRNIIQSAFAPAKPKEKKLPAGRYSPARSRRPQPAPALSTLGTPSSRSGKQTPLRPTTTTQSRAALLTSSMGDLSLA